MAGRRKSVLAATSRTPATVRQSTITPAGWPANAADLEIALVGRQSSAASSSWIAVSARTDHTMTQRGMP